jgi:hypothetical protein
MEILGGGPDDGETLRRQREREDDAARRRPVASSLDLGTMELDPAMASWAQGQAQTAAPQTAAPQTGAPQTGAPQPGAPSAVPPAARAAGFLAPSSAAAGSPAEGTTHATGGTTPGPPQNHDGIPPDGPVAAHDPLTDGPHVRDYRSDVVATMLSSASLALTSAFVSLAALTGAAPVLLLYARSFDSGGSDLGALIGKAVGGVGAVTAVLAFASLRRTRGTTPRWVPPLAAAMLTVSVLLLTAAGLFWWLSGTPALDGLVE